MIYAAIESTHLVHCADAVAVSWVLRCRLKWPRASEKWRGKGGEFTIPCTMLLFWLCYN